MAYRPAPGVVPGPAVIVRLPLGDELHVPRGAILPEVCLACGAHGVGVELRTAPREVGWMPSILIVSWFLNPLLGLLAVALLRKRSALVYSLCLGCTRRRLDGFAVQRAIFVGAVVSFLASLIAILNERPLLGVAIAFGCGLLGWGAYRRFAAARGLDVLWIHEDGTIAFRGLPAAALQSCAAELRGRP